MTTEITRHQAYDSEQRDDGLFIYFTDHQASLDAVLKEAIWAMETLKWMQEQMKINPQCLQATRADEFLASPAVRDYRARQERP